MPAPVPHFRNDMWFCSKHRFSVHFVPHSLWFRSLLSHLAATLVYPHRRRTYISGHWCCGDGKRRKLDPGERSIFFMRPCKQNHISPSNSISCSHSRSITRVKSISSHPSSFICWISFPIWPIRQTLRQPNCVAWRGERMRAVWPGHAALRPATTFLSRSIHAGPQLWQVDVAVFLYWWTC